MVPSARLEMCHSPGRASVASPIFSSRFARAISSARLAVQTVQHAEGEQARPNPVLAKLRAGLIFALFEGQLTKRQGQTQPLHHVHGLQHIAQVDQVLFGGVRSDLSRLDPVEPVLAEVQHVVAGEVGDLLVTDDRDEVLHRLIARRFPAAQLCLPQDAERLGKFDQASSEGADCGHVFISEGQRAAAQFGLVQLAGDVVERSAFGGELRAPSLQMVQQVRIDRAQQDVCGPHQAA